MPMPLATDLTPKTIVMPEKTETDLVKEVRTRFAPSPTGFLHIGGLRTALYAYLLAKHYKGKFLLRLEDTDRTRFVPGAITDIMNSLKWAGMEPDEYSVFNEKEEYLGDKGDLGPYMQSKRLDIYKKYAEQLVGEGKAYYCFCTSQRLEKMRAEQTAQKIITHYDKTCRNLSAEEIETNLKNNIPHVIRFKSPDSGETLFDDLIKGTVKFKNRLVDDYILLKSDGYPTYHLASVVDDHLMEITHIIRGEEWLSSAPVHKLLYEAFSWDAPYFAHLPNILGTDKKKLSKRTGDVAVSLYMEKGYLPEAIINFILLLGWNPGTEKEIFNREEMIAEFSLDKVGKSGAIFDLAKLDWMNGHYIRSISLDELTMRCIPYLVKAGMIEEIINDKFQISNQFQNPNFKTHPLSLPLLGGEGGGKFKIKNTGEKVEFDWLKKVVALEQNRIKKLADLPELVKYLFIALPEYDKNLLLWKKMADEDIKNSLALTREKIEKIPEEEFNKEKIQNELKEITEKIGVGETLWPFRVAMTGLKASAGPYEVAEVLGKNKVLERIGAAIGKFI